MTAAAVGVMAFLGRQKEKRRTIRDTNAKLDAVQRTLTDAIRSFRPRHFSADDLEDEITGSNPAAPDSRSRR